ncbi:hypothetical protein ACFLVO_00020 [Chloroflexota bacterium]
MKRKITLLVLLCTGIVLGYLSFIAWSVGFLLAKYLGSNKVGEPSKLRSHFIPLGKYQIHLHHWIMSSCAIIVFAVFKGAYVIPSDLFYGFFGAIVFHGIYCYSDWYRILILRQVQTLVVSKNLAIGKIVAAANITETEQEIGEKQTKSRICPLLAQSGISPIGDSDSVQDEGFCKNVV